MTNLEIVNQVINSGNWFNGTAEVSVMSSNAEVQISTKNVFVRMSEIERLRTEIEKWEKVKDIEVSPMPLRNNALAITVIF
jgi:hypothetical protein